MNRELTTDSRPLIDISDHLPLVLAVLAVFATWLLVQAVDFSSGLQPLIFGLLAGGLLVRQRAVVYLAVAGALFLPLSNMNRVGNFPLLIAEDVWFALVLILYVTLSIRYIDVATMYRRASKQEQLAANRESGAGKSILLRLRPIVSGWLWIPLALMSAVVVLWMIPWDLASDERIRIKPSGMRAISILWLLGLIWLVADGIFGIATRLRLSPRRAAVYARSLFCRELRWELGLIERRRSKKIRRPSGDETPSAIRRRNL